MCKKCGKCCTNLILPLGLPANEDVEKWLSYHNVPIVKRDPIPYIELDIKCSKLINNKCSIYKDRPENCKIFNC